MSSSKTKVVNETDPTKVDKRYKNKNKFCKGCKLRKECYKGFVAIVLSCLDYV